MSKKEKTWEQYLDDLRKVKSCGNCYNLSTITHKYICAIDGKMINEQKIDCELWEEK